MPDGAIFHFDVGPNVKAGHARAASDYRARAGSDAARGGHLAGGLVGWSGTREALWDTAEAAEVPKRRRVSDLDRQAPTRTVARSIILALPTDLPQVEQERLLRGFALHLRDKHGVATQWDLHAPDPKGDHRNTHGHMQVSARTVGEDGLFGKKTRELDDKATSGKHLSDWREEWAKRVNRALQKHGSTKKVEHRSHAVVAAETGAVPKPPRPRAPVSEYQRVRVQFGQKPLLPPAYSAARKAAEDAETARQAAVAAREAVAVEERRVATLQERARLWLEKMIERGRQIAANRTKVSTSGTKGQNHARH